MKRPKSKSKSPLKVLLVAAAMSIFVFSCLKQNTGKIDLTLTATERNEPTVRKTSSENYSEFSHTVAEHKEINCDDCHKRTGDSLDLKYPGHNSCVGCHLNEFTNSQSGICIMCHSDLKAVPAAMKAFPVRFREGFNMKFDHAAHIQGEGLPAEGCSACHLPQGASLSTPVGQIAHAQCFTCHTSESKIGSCSVCHDLAPYRRTPATTAVLNAVFSHADHTFRTGVNCSDCHTVRAGAVQSQQVSAPVAVQHFSSGGAVSCRTCHNDSTAFGQTNFANCKRCHGGPGFDMLPNGIARN